MAPLTPSASTGERATARQGLHSTRPCRADELAIDYLQTESRLSKQLPTATLVAKIKASAKSSARAGGMSHAEALEQGARAAGYLSWHELQQALKGRAAEEAELPLDPDLPPDFDNTPNDERSEAELDAWWERPFAISCEDGTFDVRCLDGGAWDRSTWYGNAPTMAAATEVARAKLEAWRAMSSRPALMMEEGRLLVIKRGSRPDQEPEVLFEAKNMDEVQAFMQTAEK